MFETGSPGGDYANISIYHDGPGKIRQITYGRWQTTEYGNLKTLIKDYAGANGSFSADLRPYVDKIGKTPLTDNAAFKSLLIRAGKEDSIMRSTQEAFFERVYFKPAMKWADSNGFILPLSALVIYDSYIHSGSIRKDIRSMFPEKPPAAGGQEMSWITAYVNARQAWLLASSNPDLHTTIYRTECFTAEINRGNWPLTQVPIDANGTPVSP